MTSRKGQIEKLAIRSGSRALGVAPLIEAYSGVLAKHLPDPDLVDVDGLSADQCYEGVVTILYMLMYGNNFDTFKTSYNRVIEDYMELWEKAQIPNTRQAEEQLEAAVIQRHDSEWLTVKSNRQRLANKVFFEDWQVTELLLSKAIENVRNGEDGAIADAERVLKLRAQYAGTFAPEKIEIGVEKKASLTDAMRERLREAALEIEDETQALLAAAEKIDSDREAMFADDDPNIIEGEVVDVAED